MEGWRSTRSSRSLVMRGTGKTTKLLKATPQGGVFVVQNMPIKRYIDQWIHNNQRDKDDIQVICVEHLDALRGRYQRPLAIDHCVADSLDLLSHEQSQELLIAMSMAPFVLSSDEDGDVVTHWNN